MARRDFLTDEQVEQEIEMLKTSPYVALARREQRIKYRRRQFLYQLRDLEKRGRKLAEDGYTGYEDDAACEEMERYASER